MAVAKTLEIISSSTESIEAAVRDGIAKAAETVAPESIAPELTGAGRTGRAGTAAEGWARTRRAAFLRTRGPRRKRHAVLA